MSEPKTEDERKLASPEPVPVHVPAPAKSKLDEYMAKCEAAGAEIVKPSGRAFILPAHPAQRPKCEVD